MDVTCNILLEHCASARSSTNADEKFSLGRLLTAHEGESGSLQKMLESAHWFQLVDHGPDVAGQFASVGVGDLAVDHALGVDAVVTAELAHTVVMEKPNLKC